MRKTLRTENNKRIRMSKQLEVDRSRWVFGGKRFREELGETAMLNDQGNMCCLGQICYQAGVGAESLLEQADPEDALEREMRPLTKMRFYGPANTTLACQAMRINDSKGKGLQQREYELQALFREAGYKLKFTGKYPESVLAGKRRR